MTSDRPMGLHWAIKRSFLDYILRMPDGRATASDGATPTAGNVMVFEPSVVATPPGLNDADVVLAFRGDVRFAGHGGLLAVRISDPWIIAHGDQAVMTVLDPHEPATKPRLPLVHLTLEARPSPGDVRLWSSKDVRLAPDGVELFNDVYQPGEPFEPLAILVPATTPTT